MLISSTNSLDRDICKSLLCLVYKERIVSYHELYSAIYCVIWCQKIWKFQGNVPSGNKNAFAIRGCESKTRLNYHYRDNIRFVNRKRRKRGINVVYNVKAIKKNMPPMTELDMCSNVVTFMRKLRNSRKPNKTQMMTAQTLWGVKRVYVIHNIPVMNSHLLSSLSSWKCEFPQLSVQIAVFWLKTSG